MAEFAASSACVCCRDAFASSSAAAVSALARAACAERLREIERDSDAIGEPRCAADGVCIPPLLPYAPLFWPSWSPQRAAGLPLQPRPSACAAPPPPSRSPSCLLVRVQTNKSCPGLSIWVHRSIQRPWRIPMPVGDISDQALSDRVWMDRWLPCAATKFDETESDAVLHVHRERGARRCSKCHRGALARCYAWWEEILGRPRPRARSTMSPKNCGMVHADATVISRATSTDRVLCVVFRLVAHMQSSY